MKIPDTTIKLSPKNDFVIVKIPVVVVNKCDYNYWALLAENARKLAKDR
jgi:hypothetical protein